MSNEWIKIENEKDVPALGKKVLAYNGHEVFIGWTQNIMSCGFKLGWSWERNHGMSYKVTHWMEIPKRPS